MFRDDSEVIADDLYLWLYVQSSYIQFNNQTTSTSFYHVRWGKKRRL